MLLDRILGNASRLPLPLVLSLRSQLILRRGATVLTVLSLAASVGLATTVELSTRSVSQALETTAAALLGSAEIAVTAGDVGVPDELVEAIRALPGVRSASPVIQRTLRVASGPRAGEPVSVFAIDLLYSNEVRSYSVLHDGFTVRDPLRLLAAPNTLVVSQALAGRLGLAEGDALALRTGADSFEFVVRGTLAGPLAEAYGGQVAVADLYGLQRVLGLPARVDRIDVEVDDSLEPGAAMAAIQERVGAAAAVKRSDLRERYVDSILETLNASVWTMALMAVLLSLLLTYTVTSLAVDRRLEEFALLRAAGMSGRSVSSLIVLDALLLALVATAIGFAAATVFADPVVSVFSRASAYLQHAEIPASRVRGSTLAVAFLVGIPVAVLAAAEPAWRAGRRPPLEVLGAARTPPAPERGSLGLLALGGAAAGIALLVWLLPSPLPDGARLVAMGVLGPLAVAAGVAQLLIFGFRFFQALLGRLIPRLGYLVSSFLLDRPVETGGMLAVWAAVSALLLSLFGMTNSLVSSIDEYWVGLHGPDVVMTFAADPLLSRDRDVIPRDSIRRMRETPGVAGVAEYYNITVMFRGEPVVLESFATRVLAERAARLSVLSEDPEATLAALERGELVMNHAFSRHFGLSVGEEVVLATDRGPARFRIGGFANSYAGPTGQLFLDIDAFERWFHPPGAIQVALWTEGPRAGVLDAVRARVAPQPLFFSHGEAFRQHTRRVIAKFDDLLRIPILLVAAIAVLALVNLMLGNVVARRRELAILRAAGATPSDRVLLMLWNGLILGALGTLCGLALSVPWSQIATDVVAGELGYQISYAMHGVIALWIAAGALLLSAAAALVPALIVALRAPAGATGLE
jgi:putative ABC transport system permease protein